MTKAGLLGAILVAFAIPSLAQAGERPGQAGERWCAVKNLGDLSENCYFTSLQQCKASLTGNSDFCRRDGRSVEPRYPG
jgi:hypothetical protein